MKSLSHRIEGRRLAFTLLYQLSFDQDIENLIHNNEQEVDQELIKEEMRDLLEGLSEEDAEMPALAVTPEAEEFALDLVSGVIQNLKKIKTLIEEKLDRPLKRVDKMTVAALLLGCYEITSQKTEKAIVLDELIELLKVYGDKGAFSLVNAVLDKIKV